MLRVGKLDVSGEILISLRPACSEADLGVWRSSTAFFFGFGGPGEKAHRRAGPGMWGAAARTGWIPEVPRGQRRGRARVAAGTGDGARGRSGEPAGNEGGGC